MAKDAAKTALNRGDARAAAEALARLPLQEKAQVLLEHCLSNRMKGKH